MNAWGFLAVLLLCATIIAVARSYVTLRLEQLKIDRDQAQYRFLIEQSRPEPLALPGPSLNDIEKIVSNQVHRGLGDLMWEIERREERKRHGKHGLGAVGYYPEAFIK